MSTLKVDKLDPSSGTALEIGSSGDTMTVPSGATFTVAGTLGATSAANLTSIPAANVTGVLPVGVTGGSGLSALNATNLTSGAVPAARFPAGSVCNVSSVYYDNSTTQVSITGTQWTELHSSLRLTHTCASSSNVLLMTFHTVFNSPNTSNIYHGKFYNQGASADITVPAAVGSRSPLHWATRVSEFDANDFMEWNMMARYVPGNTSAQTYSPYFRSPSGADVDFFQSDLDNNSGWTAPAVFHILEIVA